MGIGVSPRILEYSLNGKAWAGVKGLACHDGNRGGNRGQSEGIGVSPRILVGIGVSPRILEYSLNGKAWAGVKGLACHENREWNMRERSIM